MVWKYVIVVGAVLTALTAAFFAGVNYQSTKDKLATATANNKQYKAMEKQSAEDALRALELEKENQKLRQDSKNRKERIVYVRKNSNIDDCIIPNDGLRAINEARAATNTPR